MTSIWLATELDYILHALCDLKSGGNQVTECLGAINHAESKARIDGQSRERTRRIEWIPGARVNAIATGRTLQFEYYATRGANTIDCA